MLGADLGLSEHSICSLLIFLRVQTQTKRETISFMNPTQGEDCGDAPNF